MWLRQLKYADITMKVIKGLENFRFHGPVVVTLGVFDGVHLGHQKIIRTTVCEAHKLKVKSAVLTFEPHPLEVLEPGNHPPLLTDLMIKSELIDSLGVDLLLVIDFNRQFACMAAVDFVRDLLVSVLQTPCVVVGKDYRFGDKAQGDLALLKNIGREFGFKVVSVSLDKFRGEAISSTRIRFALEEGLLDQVIAMLGHYPLLAGRIIPGLSHGAKVLGFPTANLELEDNLVTPKNGVYACFVRLGNEKKPGVANIGFSPTLHVARFRIEVHIIDFSGDIKGQRLEIELVKRLRDERAFSNEKALSRQIQRDIQAARVVLKEMSQKTPRALYL